MTEHHPPGRRRYLTDEEIDLWLHVASGISRLPGRTLPERRRASPAPSEAVPLPAPSPQAAPPKAAKPVPPLAPIDRRLRQRITRGRTAIDDAIDLHGMNQTEAYGALRGFLMCAQAEGEKLVLVVTGKGRAGIPDPLGLDREAGVLRRLVPHWLRSPDLRRIVLGFEEAASPHGGTGALYVLLRRPGRGRPR